MWGRKSQAERAHSAHMAGWARGWCGAVRRGAVWRVVRLVRDGRLLLKGLCAPKRHAVGPVAPELCMLQTPLTHDLARCTPLLPRANRSPRSWVAAYNNASALCDSLATQSSCNVTTPRLSLNLTVDPAILKNLSSLLPSFAIDALNNITNGAGISVGGSTTILGGAGGGAAGMAATAWWTVALAAVAALVLGHGVDQHPRWL